MAAKRLEEDIPLQVADRKAGVKEKKREEVKWKPQPSISEFQVQQLRHLYRIGVDNLHKVLYSTLTGQQVVIRGCAVHVEQIVGTLQCFLPARKFHYPGFGYTYKTPDVCNIVGLDLSVAVPKSTDKILRLDVVPFEDLDIISSTPPRWVQELSTYCYFVKTELKLPEKLPSLIIKIVKALGDKSLNNVTVRILLQVLMKKWIHTAEAIRELRQKHKDLHALTSQMQLLGVQEQDYPLIEFWSS